MRGRGLGGRPLGGRGLGGRPLGEPGSLGLIGGGAAINDGLALVAKYGGEIFDFRRTDTTYQQAYATPVADDASEPVGYVTGIGQWARKSLADILTAATELVPGGTTGSLTGWTQGSNHTLSSVDGKFRIVSMGTGFTNFAFTTVVGRVYRVESRIVSTDCPNFYGVRKADDAGASLNVLHLNVLSGGPQYGIGVLGASHFVATATTTYLVLQQNGLGGPYTTDFDDLSVKEVPGSYLTQTESTGNRPLRQVDGSILMDGTNDNLRSVLTPGSAGTLVARITAGTAGALRTIIGAGAGASNKLSLTRASDGKLAATVGSQDHTAIVGGSSIAATNGVAALRWDGTDVKLDWYPLSGAPVATYRGSQSGAPGAVAFRFGATNEAATAGNFGNDAHFVGAIFNGALTDSELASFARYLN